MNDLHMSPSGRRSLELREGKRNYAYPDPATGGDPWTIGYGQTGPGIHPGLYWTDEQCDAALTKALAETYEPPINHLVTVPLAQHEYDALCSFEYNIGVGGFSRSTLLKKLNAGDRLGAADEFMHWVIPAMLVGRRKEERAQFLGDHPAANDHPAPRASVEDVQRALGVTVDGIYGRQTRDAVLAFQKAHGLIADGIVGPRTLDALFPPQPKNLIQRIEDWF